MHCKLSLNLMKVQFAEVITFATVYKIVTYAKKFRSKNSDIKKNIVTREESVEKF